MCGGGEGPLAGSFMGSLFPSWQVAEFVLRGLGFSGANELAGPDRRCPTKDPDRTVVILQRKSRRLRNVGALAERARARGLEAVVVEFESATEVLEQIATVRCCRLFVSVMGAAQQWVSFMRPQSTLLSIGWINWKTTYYEKFAKDAGVKFIGVTTTKVRALCLPPVLA